TVETTGRASLETCVYIANAFRIELADVTRLREGDAADGSSTPTTEGVVEYLQRFRETLGARLAPLVELRARNREGSLTKALEDAVLAGRNVTVTGPTGTGKTHAVLHAALRLCSRPMISIVANARHFDGTLRTFVEGAVEPFTLLSFEALVAAARVAGTPVALIVDGFNECPAALQEKLIDGVQAILLRFPGIRLITTAQVAPPAPPSVRGDTIEVT